MPSPSLVIRRVVVHGDLGCDISCDRGLNIIWSGRSDTRLANRSGKTAFVELIQHGLGKRQDSRAKYHFEPIISQINTLFLEIETNGTILTVERSLQEITARARIHEGPYTLDIQNTPSELIDIASMSPMFLGLLGIPVVSVKTAEGNLEPLSFPLLSRGFILHQEDSFSQILDKVLPERRRADIIGFLTRITPLERFSVEDELAWVQTEAQQLERYHQSVQQFLTENSVPTLIEVEALVRSAEEALHLALEKQRATQEEIRQASSQQAPQPGRIDLLRSELLSLKQEVARIEQSLTGLRQEEERLQELLASLEVDRRKTQRLRASAIILSSVEFTVCPRCLLEITPDMQQREQYARCMLCNRPLRTTSDTPPRSIPRTEDLDFQIDETNTILKDVRRERQMLESTLKGLRDREAELGRTLDAESRLFISPVVDQLLALTHEVAQREADLARARTILGQAQSLGEISERLGTLKHRQAELMDLLQETRRPYRTRLEVLRQIYEEILQTVELPDFRSVTIDSNTLLPYINGNLYMHLGVAFRGLATVAYHLAFLELARREDTYFPKMLIVDSPAVGDLNEENHEKLLRYFASLQQKAEQSDVAGGSDWPDWQIILTTRRLTQGLEPYVRAEISNAPNRMLLRRR